MSSKYQCILFLVLFASCEYKDITPTKDTSTFDHVIFGHLGSFCSKCDVLYKIENGQLFTTNHQFNIDPTNVQFVLLPAAKYDSIKNLMSKLPTAIFSEPKNIGSPLPDAGHTYIEIKSNNVIQFWYIEAYNVPVYLQPFLSEVNKALTILW